MIYKPGHIIQHKAIKETLCLLHLCDDEVWDVLSYTHKNTRDRFRYISMDTINSEYFIIGFDEMPVILYT